MIRRHVRLLRLGLMSADAVSAFLLCGLVVGLRFEAKYAGLPSR